MTHRAWGEMNSCQAHDLFPIGDKQPITPEVLLPEIASENPALFPRAIYSLTQLDRGEKNSRFGATFEKKSSKLKITFC
jgi:hypothetical protein